MATGEPNWQADMLKSPAGKFEHPSSAMQKQSLRGLSEKLNTLEGGTNLRTIWVLFQHRFIQFWVNIFVSKVAQMYSGFWAILKYTPFQI